LRDSPKSGNRKSKDPAFSFVLVLLRLTFHFGSRKELEKIKDVKVRLENAKKELDIAQRKGDLSKAGELRYGTIPELEKELPRELETSEDEAEGSEGLMLSDAVTSKDIALVISRSTGIPVNVSGPFFFSRTSL